jgi:hypothetical protein
MFEVAPLIISTPVMPMKRLSASTSFGAFGDTREYEKVQGFEALLLFISSALRANASKGYDCLK